MEAIHNEQARFDARLPKKQKQFFEKAALLGGYRNLTDFIIRVVQEKADEIMKEKEQIIVSEWDNEIFFQAVFKAATPNNSLRQAVENYKSEFSE